MLKFISVAAVAVLAVMVTSSASADHKGPCHGAGCDGGVVGGGIGVLRDSDGNIIGKVVAITSSVSILFDMLGQTFFASVDAALPPRTEGFRQVGTVYFDNADCTGAAWIHPDAAIASAFFDEFRL